jgi:hypothetical protein
LFDPMPALANWLPLADVKDEAPDASEWKLADLEALGAPAAA